MKTLPHGIIRTARLDEIMIRDHENQWLGMVKDVVLAMPSGRIQFLSLDRADQPDSNQELVLSWDQLNYDPDSGNFKSLSEREQAGELAQELEEQAGTGLIRGRDLSGRQVRAADGEVFGELREVILDVERGEAIYALLADTSGKHYPLPWAVLSYDEDKRIFHLQAQHHQLRSAPHFGKGGEPQAPFDWSERVWAERVHEHYGVQPFWTVSRPK
ncbi:PRC-barrel domain-containing protein [Aquibaculum arenosum]|uniref:PRC-barrel domain-containing protein n=1 Tax=Aquibaculum arenosum TaxID=3032591 RepID=A0ABT5YKB1_9PROT|nr:PRC-barrel domain-containing protein [Fodinicurvata sp. CAU 1616]MDF2095348.1 PRC-barrel domain-containing protein [Fodinicurvata sp. CAU 1616]